jgi:hypothetical protein
VRGEPLGKRCAIDDEALRERAVGRRDMAHGDEYRARAERQRLPLERRDVDRHRRDRRRRDRSRHDSRWRDRRWRDRRWRNRRWRDRGRRRDDTGTVDRVRVRVLRVRPRIELHGLRGVRRHRRRGVRRNVRRRCGGMRAMHDRWIELRDLDVRGRALGRELVREQPRDLIAKRALLDEMRDIRERRENVVECGRRDSCVGVDLEVAEPARIVGPARERRRRHAPARRCARIVEQILVVKVRALGLARDELIELAAELPRELARACRGRRDRCGLGRRLPRAHVAPAGHEPRAEQRGEQHREDRGRDRDPASARGARHNRLP